MAVGPGTAAEAVRAFDPAALRRLRQERGLSLDALAELVGISRSNLIPYEHERTRPSPGTLRRLAEGLGVDPLELTTVTAETATLADLRARRGLTKTELAAQLGVPRHRYERVERGVRTLEEPLVAALAEALGVTVGVLASALERARTGSPG